MAISTPLNSHGLFVNFCNGTLRSSNHAFTTNLLFLPGLSRQRNSVRLVLRWMSIDSKRLELQKQLLQFHVGGDIEDDQPIVDAGQCFQERIAADIQRSQAVGEARQGEQGRIAGHVQRRQLVIAATENRQIRTTAYRQRNQLVIVAIQRLQRGVDGQIELRQLVVGAVQFFQSGIGREIEPVSSLPRQLSISNAE